MTRVIALFSVLVLLTAAHARADVLVAFETPKGTVDPLPKGTPVWVKCFECQTLKGRIASALTKAGYEVVPSPTDTSTRVVFAVGVSVPRDGKAPRLSADDVYGKGFPSIPPALSNASDLDKLTKSQSSPQPQYNIASDGVVSMPVGYVSGSVLVSLLLSVPERVLWHASYRNKLDAARIPGVAELLVTTVSSTGERRSFRVLAASTTSATPDVLIEAATAAAVEGLLNGVPDMKTAQAGSPRADAKE